MLQALGEIRKQYGSVFLTIIPDGPVVPWQPLPLGSYIDYAGVSVDGTMPAPIEDEIFSQCVADKTLVRQLDYLPAGLISTVVQNILNHSGPVGIDAFNQDLEDTRAAVNGGSFAVIYEMIDTILKVFPSYTPEDVLAMDYKTFLNRLILSERRLLQTGLIKEPIQILHKDAQPKKKKPKVDLKKLFDIQQQDKQAKVQQRQKPVIKPDLDELEGTDKWWDVSPILEAPEINREKISFNADNEELDATWSTQWEKINRFTDPEIQKKREQMIKEAQIHYKPTLDALQKRRQAAKRK